MSRQLRNGLRVTDAHTLTLSKLLIPLPL